MATNHMEALGMVETKGLVALVEDAGPRLVLAGKSDNGAGKRARS